MLSGVAGVSGFHSTGLCDCSRARINVSRCETRRHPDAGKRNARSTTPWGRYAVFAASRTHAPYFAGLPNGNSVFVQMDASGTSYAPCRLDIKDIRSTWMGSIPHSRNSQVDAWNEGRHDGWIEAKRSGNREYSAVPMTIGHYTRGSPLLLRARRCVYRVRPGLLRNLAAQFQISD